MSPLLRRPDMVPSLFSLGIEADDRLALRRQPKGIGSLQRALRRRSGTPAHRNAGRIALSSLAVALVSKPLLKGALLILGLAISP